MRITLCFVVTLLVTLAAGCSRPEAPAEFHWQSVGATGLRAQTNAPVLSEALQLPAAAAVTAPFAHRLAEVWWHIGTGGKTLSVADATTGQTLLTEALRLRSGGELMLNSTGGHEFAIALQGLGDGATAWENNWMAWVKSMHAARGGGGEPATLKKDGWVIAVSDATLLPTASAWKHLNSHRLEPGALIQFDANYPGQVRLKGAMTASDGFARWTATATLAKPLPNQLLAWTLPSGLREPIILFTAVRALPALAESLPWIRSWSGRSIPNELFVWGQTGPLYAGHTYFAASMEDPKSTVHELYSRLRPFFGTNTPPQLLGNLRLEPSIPRLSLTRAAPVVPAFETQTTNGTSFLTFGFVPDMGFTNPIPPAMVAQLERTNLIYYDWEITEQAAAHWHLIGQLIGIIEGRLAVVNTPANQWLEAARPKIGETVTEGLITGPNTVTLRRKSPLGLTGIELAALAKWIDPPPPFVPKSSKSTNAPTRKSAAQKPKPKP